MLNSLKSISFDKFSPRAADINGSMSSIHYNQGKSVRYIRDPSKQEDPLKRHLLPQPLSSERRSGLVPLNKIMNKSHSSTMLHKIGLSLAAKRPTLQNDEVQETNTTLDNKSMIRLLSTTDLKPISKRNSTRRGKIGDTKIQYFTKGNEEVEDVKQLDNWQLEVRKKKILSNDTQYKDMLKKSVGAKDSHQMIFPKINTQLIDRIFQDSDDEEEAKKKKVETMSEAMKALVPDRNKDESHKSLDVRIFENKEDIGNMLVIKKVKQYLKTHNTEMMNTENLNSQAESIAREAFNHFKSMKGVFAKNNIVNCVKLVTENKQLEKHHEGLFDPAEREKYMGKTQDRDALINYKEIEVSLRKSLERANEIINALTWKRSHLKGEAKRIQHEQKQFDDQMNQIAARELELTVMQPISAMKKSKEPKNDAKNDYIIKVKEELKQHRIEIQQKLENVKGKLQTKENDIVSLEQNLKEAKEDKSKCKIQLKDLYLNLLKDEAYILKAATVSSYVWVIQALSNLGKKLEEEHFPSYLEKEAIYYTMECAKMQDTLVKFCNEHNLLDAISDTESFKYGNAKDITALIKNAMSPIKTAATPAFTEEKTYNSILSDFQNRMKKMKRENLKVKEQINPLHTGFRSAKAVTKMRYIVSSQAPTNETLSFHQSLLDNDSKLFSTAVDTNYINNNKGLKIDIFDHNDEAEEQQTVKHILDELDRMKLEERDRMLKKHIAKDPDIRQKETLLKTYIFLFGKQEGKEFFNELCKQQKIYHQKQRYGSPEASNSSTVRSLTPASSPLRGSRIRIGGDMRADLGANSTSVQRRKSKDPFEITLKSAKNSESPNEPRSAISPLKNVQWAVKQHFS